jgi:hypothetical protein
MKMQSKYVRRRRAVAVGLLVGVIWWANSATTPKECKVPLDQMSQFCVDLMYP